MSSYNRKVTEYALLPNGAYPLDARSHFKDFIEAYNKISANKVCAAEDAKIYGNDKLYYIGEIITTTGYGTWQVVNELNDITLYFVQNAEDNTRYDVRWGTNEESSKIGCLYAIKHGSFNFDIYQTDDQLFLSVRAILDTYSGFKSCIIPFSGSNGSGGGGKLSIEAEVPLKYDSITSKLSLSIGQGLKTENNQLTLSIGSGLKFNEDNQLTLSIGSGLKLNSDNSVDVVGNHTTINNTDAIDLIKNDNYIYLKL